MRTNIVINDVLMEEAFKYTNLKTKKEVVNVALEAFVENAKRLSLLDLKGKVMFDETYDYKKLREAKCT
jgi:Arc/MetJ family transcription regulator